MSYNEILFILDENNYDVGYEEFKEKFMKFNKLIYQASDNLKELLKLLNIHLNMECVKLGYITVNNSIFHKIDCNKPKLLCNYRHTHLHRPKIDKEVGNITNNIYKSFLGFTPKNKK